MSPPSDSPFRKAPSSPPEQSHPAGDIRTRVQRHTQKLLTASAIAAAISSEACRHDPGYMVVDMMPAPGNCEPWRLKDYRLFVYASQRGNILEVSASISDPGRRESVAVNFDPKAIALKRATLIKVVEDADRLSLTASIPDQTSSVEISAVGRCGWLPSDIHFSATVDLTKGTNGGERIVTITETNLPRRGKPDDEL